jgi:hypothetical protein
MKALNENPKAVGGSGYIDIFYGDGRMHRRGTIICAQEFFFRPGCYTLAIVCLTKVFFRDAISDGNGDIKKWLVAGSDMSEDLVEVETMPAAERAGLCLIFPYEFK